MSERQGIALVRTSPYTMLCQRLVDVVVVAASYDHEDASRRPRREVGHSKHRSADVRYSNDTRHEPEVLLIKTKHQASKILRPLSTSEETD